MADEKAPEAKTIVVATLNEHKIAEIEAIAGSFGYTAVSREAAGAPDFEIEETGATFEENSLLKAQAVFDFLGGTVAVAADDSGLEVDALGGAPGVCSARFAGTRRGSRSRQDRANNAKLLRLLEGTPEEQRTARFVSVITCLRPGKAPVVCRGEVEGKIGFEERGDGGFGYDPLFVPLGYERCFGLFSPEEKNAISHRGRALARLAEKLAEDPL